LIINLCYTTYSALLLSGSIIYRSARGTKHFGYRQLDTDLTEHSGPMQRSLTSVHPKQHERRTDGIGFRMHGRSNISSYKVAPLAPVNKQEDLLINFDDDYSTVPQTAPTVTGSQQQVSQSSADVLSLLDSSIAEKYERLPPALTEKQHVPYDPFEISEDLKNYASQNATAFHGSSNITASEQCDTLSLHHSWSSFDSSSSQDVNDGTELTSPTLAIGQNQVTSDRIQFGSTTSSQLFAAGAADAKAKTGSETDLLTYANIPLTPSDDIRGRSQVSNYNNRHSYSYSDASRPSNRRSRRHNRNDQLASHEVIGDVNANSVVPRPVSIADSVSDAISQLSVHSTSVTEPAAATSPAVGQTLFASTATWDGKSLSKHMRAAKKKMPSTGSVFYDNADDDHDAATGVNSCRDWNTDNSAPPVPPRDYIREDTARVTQPSDAMYANVSERTRSIVSTDTSGTRQLAEVRPFIQASSDVYQNFSEFSQSGMDNAGYTVYANIKEQLPAHQGSRSSLVEATVRGEVGQLGGSAGGHSAVHQVRRRVPAATLDDCQAALVCCYGDVESAIKHLKVEQLTRLGIAPRERCQMLLEACNWNLESAGSVLLHELSAGSPV